LTNSADEADHIAVDPHVSPEPVGHQIRTRPIARLAEVRFPIVVADILGDLGRIEPLQHFDQLADFLLDKTVCG
jgi:hypothetical protein